MWLEFKCFCFWLCHFSIFFVDSGFGAFRLYCLTKAVDFNRMGVGAAKLLQRPNMLRSQSSRLIFKETSGLGIFGTRWHPPVVKMSSGESINIQAAQAWSQTTVSNMYEQTRPDYNYASVEFLLEKIGALKEHSPSNKFTIAELGAGTGKFTRAVLKVLDQHSIKNVKVVSTEPIEEMCGKFREMVPNVEILQCPAENLSLPTISADAVLAAQCFHWFANAESVSEIHRVLKPKGVLGIIWNLPDQSVPWIKAAEEMFAVKYREHRIARPELSKEWLHQINNHGGFGALNEDASYRFHTNHDFESLMERFKSVSVLAAADDIEKKEMLMKIEDEIRASYDVKNQKNYTFDYVVEIKWFQKK